MMQIHSPAMAPGHRCQDNVYIIYYYYIVMWKLVTLSYSSSVLVVVSTCVMLCEYYSDSIPVNTVIPKP